MQSAAPTEMSEIRVDMRDGSNRLYPSIVDNYFGHKQLNILKSSADHPRRTFHFTRTTGRQIRRGVFPSVIDLQRVITRYIDAYNSDCWRFVRATSAKVMFVKLVQGPCTCTF